MAIIPHPSVCIGPDVVALHFGDSMASVNYTNASPPPPTPPQTSLHPVHPELYPHGTDAMPCTHGPVDVTDDGDVDDCTLCIANTWLIINC